MTETLPRPSAAGLDRITLRRTGAGLVTGAYWPKFPDLLPEASDRLSAVDCEGFVSDVREGAATAGHRVPELEAVADLLGLELRVRP